jgi:hypothetical protein
LSDEAAEAIASVDYRDDSMKVKRIYTAWDNRKDEERLICGAESAREIRREAGSHHGLHAHRLLAGRDD